jgi:hypothetical protein
MTSLLVQVDQPADIRRAHGPCDPAHAGVPGSGPEGMTCGLCLWSVRQADADGRHCLKCSLTDWDWELRTDIGPDDPACCYFDVQRPTR